MENSRSKEKRLALAAGLNFATVLIQLAGGIVSGSLSLISDTLHNFSDAAALLISFFAVKLSVRKNTESKTFGYKRAEILAALFNACALVLVSVYLFKEAFIRFTNPRQIDAAIMLLAAFFGLLANIASVVILRKHAHRDLNVRAAYTHLFSDFLSSVAVIAGGCAIFLFKTYWIDPLLTFIIGIYVLREGYKIIEESINILMHYVPKGIDLKDIRARIGRIEGVKDIHNAHIWAVTERDIYFQAHLNVSSNMLVSRTCVIKQEVEKLLRDDFGITDVTLQFEFDFCETVPLVKP